MSNFDRYLIGLLLGLTVGFPCVVYLASRAAPAPVIIPAPVHPVSRVTCPRCLHSFTLDGRPTGATGSIGKVAD